MTVAQAMADYVDYLQTSGREGAAITAERAGRLHVLPQLGEVQVQALTTEQLPLAGGTGQPASQAQRP